MKIQSSIPGVDTTPATSGSARSDATRPAAPASAGRSGSGGDSDTVRIDPRASLLASAEASLAESPAFDPARVEAIKQAIAEGRFEVDSRRVAERLLNSVRDLLLTRGG